MFINAITETAALLSIAQRIQDSIECVKGGTLVDGGLARTHIRAYRDTINNGKQ
jgi:hypothetical protein